MQISLRTALLYFVALIFLFASATSALAGEPRFVSRQVMVQFKDSTSIEDARNMLNGSDYEVLSATFPPLWIYLLNITNPDLSETTAVSQLQDNKSIKYAHLAYIFEPTVTPNDPGFADQWNLVSTSAPAAWNIATGNRCLYGGDIAVAVIDVGFNRDHAELQGHEWINLAELNGSQGVDDDSNGTVDDICGARFYTPGEDPDGTGQCPQYADEWQSYGGHGTSVAGAVSVATNNDTMLAATDWGAQIIPLSTCKNTWPEIDSSLYYAYRTKMRWLQTNGEYGANIVAINLSFTIPGVQCPLPNPDPNAPPSQRGFDDEIERLGKVGIITVTGVPNQRWDVDREHATPADCISDYLITVNSTATWNSIPSEEYFPWNVEGNGATSVDLAAPAWDIPVLHTWGDTCISSGSSFAAPQVASAAALLSSVPNPSYQEYSQRQCSLAVLDLKGVLLSGVDHLNCLRGEVATNGRLNVYHAVEGICSYYHDNGHSLVSQTDTATASAGAPKYVRGYSGDHAVYYDGSDVFYVWGVSGHLTSPRIYKLSSPRLPGESVSIASAETHRPSSDVYMAWLGGPQGINVLEHDAGNPERDVVRFDNPYVYEVWRLANFDVSAPDDSGSVLSSPVVAYENGTIPVMLVGVSGGSNPGVHYWRAPSATWYDYQTWTHGMIPASAGQNVTSVSAYEWENNHDTLHVAWTTANNQVHFEKGVVSGQGYTWDGASHVVVSSGLLTGSGFAHVSYCYSANLAAGFCVWEGVDQNTGLQTVYSAWGRMIGGEISWQTPSSITAPGDNSRRRAPQLHPYADNGNTVPAGYGRIALTNEWQQADSLYPTIECRSLWVNELNPRDATVWQWNDPVRLHRGKCPSITNWSSNGFGVFYTSTGPTAPFSMVFDSVQLTYGSPHWTLANSPYIVLDSLHIVNGVNLVVDAGVEVRGGTNGALVVDAGGKLTVNGTTGNPVTFHANTTGGTWHGIFVNGGQLSMRDADFHDANTYTIHTEAPTGADTTVKISHCTFEGNQNQTGSIVLRLWGSPSKWQIIDTSLIYNATNGNGLYLFNSKVSFNGDTIRDCAYVNSYLKAITGGFHNCTFSGRASYYSVLFYQAACTPQFTCCTFNNLSPLTGSWTSSIFCAGGTVPSFGYSYGADWQGGPGHPGAANVISDASPYLLTIQGSDVLPIISRSPMLASGPGGHNDWIQDNRATGKFFEWRDQPTTGQFYCERQYWERSPIPAYFSPADASYWDYTSASSTAWGACGDYSSGNPGGGNLMAGIHRPDRNNRHLDDVDWQERFALGTRLEDSTRYDEAITIFREVAGSTPDSALRWLAMTHAVTSAAQVSTDDQWVAPLIDSLIAFQNNSYGARLYGHRLLTTHQMYRQEYSDAVATCTSLLTSNLEYTDSVIVALDLVSVQMAAGLVQYSDRLDDPRINQIPAALRVVNSDQGLAIERNLLAIMGDAGTHHNASSLVPSTYKLYQNFPNPFNPTTEIRFDLPEAAHVELKVFNMMGQVVATLVNEGRAAGAHSIAWDASKVASGMYLYQIKAGKYTSTKKMLLIR